MNAINGKLKCPRVLGVSAAMWKKAIAVEMEHTDSRRVARCIASAHLQEFRDYYIALAAMEKRLSQNRKS